MLLVASGNNWLSGDQSIVTMPEQQGPSRRIMVEIEHLSDKDDVIATLISVSRLAFKDGERIGQDRTAGVPGLEIEAGPSIV